MSLHPDKTRVYQVNFKRSFLSVFHKPEMIAGYGFAALVLGLRFVLEAEFSLALTIGSLWAGLSYYLLTPREYGGEITLLLLLRKFQRWQRRERFNHEVSFEAWDNCIIANNRLILAYELTGINLHTLSHEERLVYYASIAAALNSLTRISFQCIVQKERASIRDFLPHVFSLHRSTPLAQGKKEMMIRQYVAELSKMLDTYWVHKTAVYLVFSERIQESKGHESRLSALRFLETHIGPFLNDIAAAGLRSRQLQTKELTILMKSYIE